MRQVVGNMNGGLTPTFKEGLPNLYCGIGTNIFAILYLTCRQVRIRDRVSAVVLLLFFNVSFVIRQLDYIWHGFHFTNMIPYRFSFLYSFVMLYMAYRAWTLRRHIRVWQLGVAVCFALVIMLMSNQCSAFLEPITSGSLASDWASLVSTWQGSSKNMEDLAKLLQPFVYPAYNLIFLLLFLAAGLYAFTRPKFPAKTTTKKAFRQDKQDYFADLKNRRQMGSVLLLTVFGAELVLNLVNFGVSFYPGTNVSNYPKGTEDSASIIQIMREREEDTLFYRAEVTHAQTLNDGALNGYNGISTFTSSANANVTRFMQALGYAAKDSWNRYVFEEASPVSNLFLNLKYMIERDNQVEENPYFKDLHYKGPVHLLENRAYLPLGFLTDSALGELTFDNTANRFRFQNRLLSAALGEEVTPWTLIDGEYLSIAARDVTLNSTTELGYCSYTADSAGGSVYYTYTFDRSGFFCVDLNMPKRNSITFSHEKAGGEYRTLYSETYSLPQQMAVCQVEPGDRVQLTIKCKASEKGTLDITAAVLDERTFREAYDILAESTLELTAFENTLVEGTIDCKKDGLLYTSIPQNGCWQVYVDGQEAEVTLIGDAMVGVELTQGSHTVTFRYRNKAFELGVLVSIGSLLVFLGLYFFVYQYPNLKAGKYRKK